MPIFKVRIERKKLDDTIKKIYSADMKIKKGSQKMVTEVTETLLQSCFNIAYNETSFKHVPSGMYKNMIQIKRDDWRGVSLIAGAKYSDVIEKCRPFDTKGHHILKRTHAYFVPLLKSNIRIIEKDLLKKTLRSRR